MVQESEAGLVVECGETIADAFEDGGDLLMREEFALDFIAGKHRAFLVGKGDGTGSFLFLFIGGH